MLAWGGLLLARGVVRTLLATGTVLESTAGVFLRIRSDIYVWIFENGVNVDTTTLTLFPENTQDFSFKQPQTVCQHTAYSPTLLVSDWLAFGL